MARGDVSDWQARAVRLMLAILGATLGAVGWYRWFERWR